jgi:hypothetical protein
MTLERVWDNVIGHVRDRLNRRPTAEDRFARRPSRTVLMIVGALLLGFAAVMASGADYENKILVVKPLKRVSPN